MLVTLVGKNSLYKLKLPNKQEGNYWIKSDNEKKLVNIIGKNNEWKISSNEQLKILKPKAIKSFNIEKITKNSENIVSSIILKEGSIYYLSLDNNPNMLYILICEPIYEKNFIHLRADEFQEITIGRDSKCDIIYDNLLIEEKQAKIFF